MSALPNAQAATPGGLEITNSHGEVSAADLMLRFALAFPNGMFVTGFYGELPLTNNSTAAAPRISGTIIDSLDHLSGGTLVFTDPHLFYTAAFWRRTFDAGANEYVLPLDTALPFTPPMRTACTWSRQIPA
jgi:hypothetical protein